MVKGIGKKPKASMDKMLELMDKVEQLKLADNKKKGKAVTFPFPADSLQLKQTPSDPAPPKVSVDEQYNPNLTSGSEAEDEMGDFTKRPKEMAKEIAKKKQSAAASSSGGSFFIKGQTLKPIDERYVIGSAAPLPYNDLTNDSFLIKPKPYEPVV